MCFTLLENMKILCKIQVMIYSFLKIISSVLSYNSDLLYCYFDCSVKILMHYCYKRIKGGRRFFSQNFWEIYVILADLLQWLFCFYTGFSNICLIKANLMGYGWVIVEIGLECSMLFLCFSAKSLGRAYRLRNHH